MLLLNSYVYVFQSDWRGRGGKWHHTLPLGISVSTCQHLHFIHQNLKMIYCIRNFCNIESEMLPAAKCVFQFQISIQEFIPGFWD